MNKQDTTKDINHPDYYTEQINKNGIEATEKLIYRWNKGERRSVAGHIALEKYYKNQNDEKDSKRDEREEKTLELAQEANKISRVSNNLATGAICLSIIAIVVSIFVAFLSK